MAVIWILRPGTMKFELRDAATKSHPKAPKAARSPKQCKNQNPALNAYVYVYTENRNVSADWHAKSRREHLCCNFHPPGSQVGRGDLDVGSVIPCGDGILAFGLGFTLWVMNVQVYIYIYIYVCFCITACIYIYIYISVRVCVCVCMHV